MSLLTRGRDQVKLYPAKVTTDSVGNPGKRVPDLDHPVTVVGMVQPVTSTETNREGQQVRTQKRFITRDARAIGAFAAAHIGGSDVLWAVVSEPADRTYSQATSHFTIILQSDQPTRGV